MVLIQAEILWFYSKHWPTLYHSNLSNCTPNIIVCIFHWPSTVHMQNLEIQKLLWTFNLNLLCLLQSYWWFCFNFRVQVSGVCGHVTTLQPTLPTLFILRLVQTKLTIVGVTHILVTTFHRIKTQPISKTVLLSSGINFHTCFDDDFLIPCTVCAVCFVIQGVLPHHTIWETSSHNMRYELPQKSLPTSINGLLYVFAADVPFCV